MKIIDGNNALLGRLASEAAQLLLKGEEVAVVNCDNVAISGKRDKIFAKYKSLVDKGTPFSGPYLKRDPARLVKRSIKGMLPSKSTRGREALKRIKCYRRLPAGIDEQNIIRIKSADISKLSVLKCVSMKEIVKFLGGKV